MEAHLNAEKLRKITIERVEKFLSKTAWTDINLASKIYGSKSSANVQLRVWSVPNTDPNKTDKVSYAEMRQQPDSSFVEAQLGQAFAPEWSTHWVKGTQFCYFQTILVQKAFFESLRADASSNHFCRPLLGPTLAY